MSASLSLSPSQPPSPATPAEALPSGLSLRGPDELTATFDGRAWSARGWRANPSYDRLKVALRLRFADQVCGDNVDLAIAKARAGFVAAAANETGIAADVIKADLGRLWLALEQLQDRLIRDARTPQAKPDPAASMTPERRAAALSLLQSPDLIERIGADVAACGLVGERVNAVICYLAAVSRKLPDPLAVMVQASSAAGKSSVQDTVLSLVPEEDRFEMTAVSSRALFYAEPDALRHKALSIAEQEGAAAATYSLKLMQSAGRLSIMVPVKNPDTGELSTQTRTVEGPVALFMTTTAAEIDDELQNRFLVLTVDESAGQTAAVHAAQRARETRDGFIAQRRARSVRELHHDAQRLLEPVVVFNPFAARLTFAATRPRLRRDHAKYLRLIRALTFLRQHQRERHSEILAGERVAFIESSLDDVRDANDLAAAVLGRGLDELSPQTRRLLMKLRDLVGERAASSGRMPGDVRFTRRDVRLLTGLSSTQVHVHLARLVDLEYVLCHRGATTSSQLYELVWDGEGVDGGRFLLGLADIARLAIDAESLGTTPNIRGSDGEYSGCIRGAFGPLSGPIRGGLESGIDGENCASRDDRPDRGENAYRAGADTGPVVVPYPQASAGSSRAMVAAVAP